MEAVAPDAAPTVIAELAVGDRLGVRVDGSWQDFTVVGTAATSLQLRGEDGATVTLAHDDIVELRIARKAPGKTAALAAGIYLGVLGLLCGDLSDSDGC
jgi:hypothetical protein